MPLHIVPLSFFSSWFEKISCLNVVQFYVFNCVNSDALKSNVSPKTDAAEPTSGGKTGLYASGYRFYTELWFIILMAFVGLLLVAVLLGLVLRRALRKPSFIRERTPLQPLQRRSSKYPPSDSYLVRGHVYHLICLVVALSYCTHS